MMMMMLLMMMITILLGSGHDIAKKLQDLDRAPKLVVELQATAERGRISVRR